MSLTDIPGVAYWWLACVLLCTIWLLREYVWRMRTNSRDDLLQAQHVELQGLRDAGEKILFQKEWAQALLQQQSPIEVFTGLLSRKLPTSEGPSLWVMDRVDREMTTRITVGAGESELLSRVTVSPQLWDQLEILSRVRLGEFELRQQRLLRLPNEFTQSITELFVLRCGEQVPVDRILCTTHIPQWTTSHEENLRLLGWACQSWRHPRPQPARVDDSANGEARMVRIMLELRTIADMEFASPMEMLREFLRILAKATGYERVTLYLSRPNEVPPVERFCWAGIDADHDGLHAWHSLEDQLVSEHLQASGLVLLTPETLQSGRRNPVEAAAIVPLAPGPDPIGLLCLSSRSPVHPGEIDRQIINWAARYLMQTLSKTVDRVVVEEQARRDALTKLANRHTFDHELQRQLQVSGSLGELCSLILIDLDRFKQINDTYGHPAGDAVLQEVARRMEQVVGQTRVTDRPLVARLGGEELGILLPGVGHSGAVRIAEALRSCVREKPVEFGDLSITVTSSAGIAIYPRNGRTANELIAAADAALYTAKANGRDCVHTAPALDLPPALSENQP